GYIKGIQQQQNGTISKIKASVQGEEMYKVELFFLESGRMGGWLLHVSRPQRRHARMQAYGRCDDRACQLQKPEVSSFFSEPVQKKQVSEKKPLHRCGIFLWIIFREADDRRVIGERCAPSFVLQFFSDYSFVQEKYFTVQLRIGVDKLYVVKNMEDLFASIRQRSRFLLQRTSLSIRPITILKKKICRH
ncbi:hypothetical protein, partial [Sinobaca sp. H24]|uniref:hypothetical protein n=1 Tax=Sinobaca sp. H24 TaxID=2923376 RepID=UPI00207A33DE